MVQQTPEVKALELIVEPLRKPVSQIINLCSTETELEIRGYIFCMGQP